MVTADDRCRDCVRPATARAFAPDGTEWSTCHHHGRLAVSSGDAAVLEHTRGVTFGTSTRRRAAGD